MDLRLTAFYFDTFLQKLHAIFYKIDLNNVKILINEKEYSYNDLLQLSVEEQKTMLTNLVSELDFQDNNQIFYLKYLLITLDEYTYTFIDMFVTPDSK